LSYWQRRYEVRQLALPSNAATQRITLPRIGVLSGLDVRLAWTNDVTGGGAQDILDTVTQIQVIANGSQVLFAMPGNVLARIMHMHLQRPVPQLRNDNPNVVQYASFPVLFGRFWGDPDYALDLSRYTDVELRITYAPTIDTGGHTMFLTGGGVLDVVALMSMEGPPNGAGLRYLRRTTVNNFTTAAAGIQVVQIPRNSPIRTIYVDCYEVGIADGVDITQLEVSLDNGAKTPFVGRWVDIEDSNSMYYPVNTHREMSCLATAGDAIATKWGRIKSAVVQCQGTNAAGADWPHYQVRSIAGDQVTLDGVLIEGGAAAAATIVDVTDRYVRIMAESHSVGHCVAIPFALWGNEAKVLNAPAYGAVDLLITQGGAGGNCFVVVEEVVM